MQVISKLKVVLILVVAAVVGYAGSPSSDIIWRDADSESIPEPMEREPTFAEYVFQSQFVEQWKQTLDVPRWIRAAIHPKRASNVNALDEVPDSSWYTNRHHLRQMSLDELARGPNSDAGPDFTDIVVIKAKLQGVTPGLQVKDARGDSYIIKFDAASYPELQSGAEVISTKILHAAGYNVPENYVAIIEPSRIRIADDVRVSAETGERNFTRQDLTSMLQRAASMPDGRYRVLASKILQGIPKGPFAQVGIRGDDPNDRIPHEHRRELRGLRVIASWINHWDMKEQNSLDMYVERDGRKFLKHYLIDLGSTLGGGQSPLEYFHGRAYAFDGRSILAETVTLGAYVSAAEKQGRLISPAVGAFSASDFNSGAWKPTVAMIPFDNMTDEDAFWAVRVILSFSEPELRRIVETAQYTDSRDEQYVLATLLERRRIIARHWLARVNSISDVSIRTTSTGTLLVLRDLGVDAFTDAGPVEYEYEISGGGYGGTTHVKQEPVIMLDRDTPSTTIEVTIRTRRQHKTSASMTVQLYREAGGFRVARISRG